MTFESLQIDPRCLRILNQMNITEPTPIQAQAIPPALEGRDIVAIAQTGTGKTLAFGLPALSRLAVAGVAAGAGAGAKAGPRPGATPGHTRMLVLTPTRELAQQVHNVLEPLARAVGLRTVCVYGGVGYERQGEALRRGVAVVVATPGRLLDHVQQRNTRFDRLDVLVLDEADRMLDMGFLPDIRRIVSGLPPSAARQTVMLSATFPISIARLADTFQVDPVRIEAGAIQRPVETVRQAVYTVAREGKTDLLARILEDPEVRSALVFLRTKHATDRLSKTLHRQGFHCEAIHGGLSQSQRDRAIEGFRRGRIKILVATDVAARGIDVHGISHVVNYDIPATSDDYLHRIGRTARNNASGHAITFVSHGDTEALGAIERLLGRALERTAWEGSIEVGQSFNREPKFFTSQRSGGARRRARYGFKGVRG
jgi:ATP-dependent RNA helicase RhlE